MGEKKLPEDAKLLNLYKKQEKVVKEKLPEIEVVGEPKKFTINELMSGMDTKEKELKDRRVELSGQIHAIELELETLSEARKNIITISDALGLM